MWCILYFVADILLISPLRSTYSGAVEMVRPGRGASGSLEQEHFVSIFQPVLDRTHGTRFLATPFKRRRRLYRPIVERRRHRVQAEELKVSNHAALLPRQQPAMTSFPRFEKDALPRLRRIAVFQTTVLCPGIVACEALVA